MTNATYKIRRISDGLFSSGGTAPYFTKQGKSWTSEGALKNHLNQFFHEERITKTSECGKFISTKTRYAIKKYTQGRFDRGSVWPYDGCEVCVYVSSPSGSFDVTGYAQDMCDQRSEF